MTEKTSTEKLEREFALPPVTGSEVWRKEVPDANGMWLAAFWDKGRWWMEILSVHLPNTTPRRADKTWWYRGPIKLLNDNPPAQGESKNEN